jgi:hypothetical protein
VHCEKLSDGCVLELRVGDVIIELGFLAEMRMQGSQSNRVFNCPHQGGKKYQNERHS